MISRRVIVLAPLLALLVTGPALAVKTRITLPAVKDGKIDNLLPVTAPEARCAVISDKLGWLAFAHRPTYKKAHVSLFHLDAQGKPDTAEPAAIKLPAPAALAKYPNYPLGLGFHPTLPLLYVWQDILLPNVNVVVPAADLKDFDHLLIYSLEKKVPELVLSLCRGADFGHGKLNGSVAVDAAGKLLYVPNLQDPKDAAVVKAGSYDLDADGLPIWSDKAAPKGGAKAARIAAINTAKTAGKPVLPQQLTPYDAWYLFPNSIQGCGGSFIPVGKETVIFCNVYAVLTWEPSNRRVKLSSFFLENIVRPHLLSSHPRLPVVYATAPGFNYAYRLHHADGHISLTPQRVILTDTVLASPPAVMSKANKVAFGGQNRVYVVSLTKEGNFKAERTQAVVSNPSVEALVYSQKYDQLYVAVEVSK